MHNQLEKYLSQIEKQLAALPAEQRQDELREIRSHLEMMIEDNVARGFDVDEAVARALKQFGIAKTVGQDLIADKNKSWRQRSQIVLALIFVLAFQNLCTLLTVWFIRDSMPSSSLLHGKWISFWILSIWIIGENFICGWVAETIAPRKSFALLTCIVIATWTLELYTSPSFAQALIAHPLPNIPHFFRAIVLGILTLLIGAWARRKYVEGRQQTPEIIIE
jgi:hypothetical protein